MRFDSLRPNQSLKFVQQFRLLAHGTGRYILLFGKDRQHSCRFADVPFGRVNTVAAVGEVRRSEIFIGWE